MLVQSAAVQYGDLHLGRKPVDRLILRHKKKIGRPAKRFVIGPAKHAIGSRIPVSDTAAQIHGDDCDIGRTIENSPITPLGLGAGR
nr:hypothetical protein [Acidisoma silvae]